MNLLSFEFLKIMDPQGIEMTMFQFTCNHPLIVFVVGFIIWFLKITFQR